MFVGLVWLITLDWCIYGAASIPVRSHMEINAPVSSEAARMQQQGEQQ